MADFGVAEAHHHVAAALLVSGGRVLLCHRHPDRQWYPDVWDLPGGHIDDGEAPSDALRRELQEELGVSVDLSSVEPWRVLTPAPDLTLHVWLVERWDGTIENHAPDEHDEIGWFWSEETDALNLVDHFLEEMISDATAG
ncbi:MAG: NUDIX domain-containing protein [Actinomycetota bacterium]